MLQDSGAEQNRQHRSKFYRCDGARNSAQFGRARWRSEGRVTRPRWQFAERQTSATDAEVDMDPVPSEIFDFTPSAQGSILDIKYTEKTDD